MYAWKLHKLISWVFIYFSFSTRRRRRLCCYSCELRWFRFLPSLPSPCVVWWCVLRMNGKFIRVLSRSLLCTARSLILSPFESLFALATLVSISFPSSETSKKWQNSSFIIAGKCNKILFYKKSRSSLHNSRQNDGEIEANEILWMLWTFFCQNSIFIFYFFALLTVCVT